MTHQQQEWHTGAAAAGVRRAQRYCVSPARHSGRAGECEFAVVVVRWATFQPKCPAMRPGAASSRHIASSMRARVVGRIEVDRHVAHDSQFHYMYTHDETARARSNDPTPYPAYSTKCIGAHTKCMGPHTHVTCDTDYIGRVTERNEFHWTAGGVPAFTSSLCRMLGEQDSRRAQVLEASTQLPYPWALIPNLGM